MMAELLLNPHAICDDSEDSIRTFHVLQNVVMSLDDQHTLMTVLSPVYETYKT